MAWTKEYRAEYMKNYRAENRDQINANKRYWLKHNPEKVKAQAKKDNKKFYEKHKNDPKYKARNAESTKRWRENNRDKWNAYCRERYHRKKLAERREA